MKLRLLMSHCKKIQWETQWEVRGGFVPIYREALCRVWAISQASVEAMECGGVVSFFELISYANEREDHSNSWGITHFSVFWQCLGTVLTPLSVSFSLQIEDQGLVEFDLSSWIHLILFSLCYALGLCHSFKSCALPLSSCFSLSSWAPSVPTMLALQTSGGATRK